jgi:hypothetical protein
MDYLWLFCLVPFFSIALVGYMEVHSSMKLTSNL